MKFEDLFQHSFKALRKKMEPKVRKEIDFMLPSMPMVEACRADDFNFFQPFIDSEDLTVDQMHHAVERYHLGKTKSGQPIFWMIDDMLQPLDARIGTTWISKLLKQREPLLEYWHVQHCLFGLHLLCHTDPTDLTDNGCVAAFPPYPLENKSSFAEQKKSVRSKRSVCENKNICVVESEASAVVLSALFPESIWMAYATTPHLSPDLFAPLEGQTVIIYPRTDPTLSTYLFFRDLVDQTLRFYNLDLHVDTTLEDHATEEQKEREIDIVDFLLENSATIPPE